MSDLTRKAVRRYLADDSQQVVTDPIAAVLGTLAGRAPDAGASHRPNPSPAEAEVPALLDVALTLAGIVVCGLATSERPTVLEPQRAKIGAAADRLTHDQIAEA